MLRKQQGVRRSIRGLHPQSLPHLPVFLQLLVRRPCPAQRAFVVQLHAEAQIEHGHFKGRVERLVSHQAAHFESLEELLAFMVRVLTAPHEPKGG